MADKKNPEERALDAVRARNPGHSDFVVVSVVPRYLQGTLYIIVFKDVAKAGFENYAYVPDNGSDVLVHRNTAQLAHAVSLSGHDKSALEKLMNYGGMSGVIAIAITATICYLTLTGKGEIKIPDVLSNALTMVLGFYFGSKAAERRD